MDRHAYELAQGRLLLAGAKLAGVCEGLLKVGAVTDEGARLVGRALLEFDAAVTERKVALDAQEPEVA